MIALQTLVEVLKYGTDYDRNGSFKPRVWRSTPGGHTHLLGNDWVQAVAPDPDPGPHSTICDRGGSTPSLQKQGPWAMGAMFISPGVFLSPIFGGGGGGRLLGPKTGQYVEKNRQSTLRGRGSGHPSVILYSRFDLIPREGRKAPAGASGGSGRRDSRRSTRTPPGTTSPPARSPPPAPLGVLRRRWRKAGEREGV